VSILCIYLQPLTLSKALSEFPQYTADFTAEPVDVAPPNTQLPAVVVRDKGYIPRGHHRKLSAERWKLVPDEGRAVLDVYEDLGTFPERGATVQIVTFYMEEEKHAEWELPLHKPEHVRTALRRPQEANTWRLIHCEGLHGPTMRAIAHETSRCLSANALVRMVTMTYLDWGLPRFARIFSCMNIFIHSHCWG